MKPRTMLSLALGAGCVIFTAICPRILVQCAAVIGVENGKNEENLSDSQQNSTENLRYHIAQFDFSNVADPFIVSICVVLASAAKIGFHLNNKLSSIFPESCLLILLGVILGLIFWALHVDVYNLDSHTFFLFLLPPIILDAGYFMPCRAFFDNIGTILLFAVVGTLFNTFTIGLTMWGVTRGLWPVSANILHMLVFSSLLSAVDPVAVLAVFEEVHVNEVLHIIVFGESLLNDGVTVVLYHMFDTYSEIGIDNITTVDIISGIVAFLVVGLGGTAIGVVYGLLTALTSRFTDHVRVIEPLLVFLMGYLSYLTAEMFHLSGILACTFCAISMKKYVEANISHKSHTTIKYFMKMLASVCETVIFILLGISTVTSPHQWDTEFVLISLLSCLVYRTIGVVVFTAIANRVRLVKLSRVDQFIMSYGGMRGAIAFALVVLLNDKLYPHKNLFVTTTVIVIFFTVFIQGSTIKPLVSLLRVKRSDDHKPGMNEQIQSRFLDHLMAGVEDVTGYHGHHELRQRFEFINTHYLKPVLVRRRALRSRGLSIVNLYQKLAEKDMRELVNSNSLPSLSKFNSVHLSQSMADHLAYTHLHGSEDQQLDTRLTLLPPPFLDHSSSTQLDLQALEALDTRKWRDDCKTHHIVADAMFRPRPKFSRHRRHMLPEADIGEPPPFHHRSRLHLRSLVNYHHHKHHNGNGNALHQVENGKPRKNVSFSQVTEVCTCEDAEADRRSDRADVETGSNSSSSHSLPGSSLSSEVNGGIIFTVTASDCIDDEPEPAQPTAVEIMLPWKRNTGRAPLPSSFTHSLPDDQHPLIGEAPSWVNNDSYTASQVNLPESLDVTQESVPSPEVVKNDVETSEDGKKGHEVEETHLPLPWRCHSSDEGVEESRKSPPTEVVIDMDVPDVLPPPWRSNNHSEVALDVRNHRGDEKAEICVPVLPWRQDVDTQPVRSPSVAQDLETYSMRPQPSCQSFRISEAESKHSEPHPVHHMIEKIHRTHCGAEHDGEGGEMADLPDGEPDVADTHERILNWLISSEPEPVPVDDFDPVSENLPTSVDEAKTKNISTTNLDLGSGESCGAQQTCVEETLSSETRL